MTEEGKDAPITQIIPNQTVFVHPMGIGSAVSTGGGVGGRAGGVAGTSGEAGTGYIGAYYARPAPGTVDKIAMLNDIELGDVVPESWLAATSTLDSHHLTYVTLTGRMYVRDTELPIGPDGKHPFRVGAKGQRMLVPFVAKMTITQSVEFEPEPW